MAQELARPSRIERVTAEPEPVDQPDTRTHNRPELFNFICMIMVAICFDVVALFVNEVPGVGIDMAVLEDAVFIPWFQLSGMGFNAKRVVSMALDNILEAVPIIGNLPLVTLNIVVSYYLN